MEHSNHGKSNRLHEQADHMNGKRCSLSITGYCIMPFYILVLYTGYPIFNHSVIPNLDLLQFESYKKSQI